MQHAHWVKVHTASKNKIYALQEQKAALDEEDKKLRIQKRELDRSLRTATTDAISSEYQVKHPFLLHVHDLFPKSVIQICESYLLFDYCVGCKKTYPKSVRTCFCEMEFCHDFNFFGRLNIRYKTIGFSDERDIELWTYLTGEPGTLIDCRTQTKIPYTVTFEGCMPRSDFRCFIRRLVNIKGQTRTCREFKIKDSRLQINFI
jgi:hypothetical protein